MLLRLLRFKGTVGEKKVFRKQKPHPEYVGAGLLRDLSCWHILCGMFHFVLLLQYTHILSFIIPVSVFGRSPKRVCSYSCRKGFRTSACTTIQ